MSQSHFRMPASTASRVPEHLSFPLGHLRRQNQSDHKYSNTPPCSSGKTVRRGTGANDPASSNSFDARSTRAPNWCKPRKSLPYLVVLKLPRAIAQLLSVRKSSSARSSRARRADRFGPLAKWHCAHKRNSPPLELIFASGSKCAGDIKILGRVQALEFPNRGTPNHNP